MLPEKIIFRAFRPKDAGGICKLLGQTFAKEYAEQGLNIYKYTNVFRCLGLVNMLLRKLHLEFFDLYVAEQDGNIVGCTGNYLIAPKAWYLGFAAVAPNFRGKHIFTSLLIPYLGRLCETDAEMTIMEIRPDNHAMINIATRRFATHILATKKIFTFIPGDHDPPHETRRRFQKADPHEKMDDQYPVQDLVPVCRERIHQGLLQCLIHRILPPTVYKSFVYKSSGGTRLFIRCRIQYPGSYWSVDALWYDSRMNQKELEETLEDLFAFLCSRTRKPVKIYIDVEDQRLRQLLEKRGLAFFHDMSFLVLYIKDIPQSLDRLRKMSRILAQRRGLKN